MTTTGSGQSSPPGTLRRVVLWIFPCSPGAREFAPAENNSLSIRANPFFSLAFLQKASILRKPSAVFFLAIDAACARALREGLNCPEIILLLKFLKGLPQAFRSASLGPGQATPIGILAAGLQTFRRPFFLTA